MNRQVLSWCLFDFANSSFSAVIAAVIFPVYYTSVIVGNESGLGDLWWGWAISLSMAVVAFSSPFLGGIADHARIRKRLLFVYTLLCVTAVASFAFLGKGDVVAGFVLIVLANIGMEGGFVFYNSFLPDIAERSHQGRVSAWGYGVGYAGSIASLLLALLLIRQGRIEMAWPMVAAFFSLFALPAFLYLPKDERGGEGIVRAAGLGVSQIWNRFRSIWSNRNERRFLIAYLIYEDGVNTVIVFSSIFAATTLHFRPEELIAMYLIVQVTALAGSFLMARPIDLWGPKRVVVISLGLWMTVSIAAYFIHEKVLFFGLASVAGFGLGTVQASSRAFFTQFVPDGQESEYFGAYALVGKSSSILGPLLFGYISTGFGSQRPAILSVALLFFAGLLIIRTVEGGRPNVQRTSA